VRTWHKGTRFLSADGKPKPLLVQGKNGLKSLIRIHFPNHKFDDVFAILRKSRLIQRKKGGRWLPTENHARISMVTPESLFHFAEGVARLAETVIKNTTSSNKSSLLFERASTVPRLPLEASNEFKKYAKVQGMAFLSAIDDWLESRTLKKPVMSRSTCQAGVYAFAFLGEPSRINPARKAFSR
jgi:hypothetical protein